MSDLFNIAFADDSAELHWFTLAPSGLNPVLSIKPELSQQNSALTSTSPETEPLSISTQQQNTASTINSAKVPSHICLQDAPNILILPTTAGLPFQFELSFADPIKVSRVIPQLVADQYAEVDENWLFSWNISNCDSICLNSFVASQTTNKNLNLKPTEGELSSRMNSSNQQACKYLVSGIAFPPELSPARLDPNREWRLAIPDFLLASVTEKSALHLKTPVNDYIAIFSGENQLDRIIADTSLPLRPLLVAAQIKTVSKVDFSNNHSDLFAAMQRLIKNAKNFDLSAYHRRIINRIMRWSIAALVALILGLVFLGHFFLWFECRLNEAAAERTRISINKAFSKIFPGVPVVDPVSQIRRKISEAQTSLNEASSIPIVDWLSMFRLIEPAALSGIRLSRLQSRADGFRIQGTASDYTSLDHFRKNIESSGVVEKVTTPESRKVGNEVVFAMEVKWKS